MTARTFFTGWGTYQISQDTTADQLMHDCTDLLDSAIDVLSKNTDTMDGSMFAAYFLLQQAKGMHDSAHTMVKAQAVRDAA
jgi:hypothetical protein